MLQRIWIPSPNYSYRGGAQVRLIVLHTAEGARTIESLGGWFQNPNAGVSSHAGADDKPNMIGEYVKRADKSWTQAEFNPQAVSLELCGFANWDTDEWHRHPNMLDNCAKWIAEEAAAFGIPITKLTASEAQGSGRGVCQHVDLGSRGGGHHDCGTGFPIDQVLDMARSGQPTPPTEEEIVAVAMGTSSNGALIVIYEDDKGDLWQTWQKKGETSWAGGQPGKSTAGLSFFAHNPNKK